MKKYPALFVHEKSNYKKDFRFDCFDEKRNALIYSGQNPAVYHPPCRLFSRLKAFAKAEESEKELAFWALDNVRKFGGILEHPYDSSLWIERNIVKPGLVDEFGGFSIVFDQFDFGYYTRKRTRLYIVGCSINMLPRLPIRFEYSTRKFSNLTVKQRSETVPDLIDWFYEVLCIIDKNVKNG